MKGQRQSWKVKGSREGSETLVKGCKQWLPCQRAKQRLFHKNSSLIIIKLCHFGCLPQMTRILQFMSWKWTPWNRGPWPIRKLGLKMLVKPKESSVVSRWRFSWFTCLFIRWTPLRGTRRVTLIPVLVIAEEIVSVCVRPLLRTHTSAVNTECLSSGGPRNCAVSNRNVKKPQNQSCCLTPPWELSTRFKVWEFSTGNWTSQLFFPTLLES